MRIEEFDYDLPQDLVAQEPRGRRDAARLMVLDRSGAELRDATISDLGEYLRPGDLLVLNDTRVVPARLRAWKGSGGRVELLLVGREADDPEGRTWCCLASTARGLRPGRDMAIAPGFTAVFLGEAAGGRVRVQLRVAEGGDVDAAIRRYGVMPVPPYIRRRPGDPREEIDRDRYQTVYARAEGAIAAPTAGLHFTQPLLRALEESGIGLAFLTLHVGPGTFQPVRARNVEDHRLDPEEYRLPAATVQAIAACRARGGRVVAVGTTVTRVLEACVGEDGRLTAGEGRCGLYIVPGHRFRVVQVLLTNFHLPRSSLLVLVSAFAGRERILAAYGEAIRRGYRFYSYGDAMLIL